MFRFDILFNDWRQEGGNCRFERAVYKVEVKNLDQENPAFQDTTNNYYMYDLCLEIWLLPAGPLIGSTTKWKMNTQQKGMEPEGKMIIACRGGGQGVIPSHVTMKEGTLLLSAPTVVCVCVCANRLTKRAVILFVELGLSCQSA